jgi:5-methylthioadenosine/S-adenosylhomocysteine deaminase
VVGRNLQAEVGEVIDRCDMIVMPDLIRCYIHTWQAGLRAIASEWLAPDSHRNIQRASPRGSLGQIDGVTTILDWYRNLHHCWVTRSPLTADAKPLQPAPQRTARRGTQ